MKRGIDVCQKQEGLPSHLILATLTLTIQTIYHLQSMYFGLLGQFCVVFKSVLSLVRIASSSFRKSLQQFVIKK